MCWILGPIRRQKWNNWIAKRNWKNFGVGHATTLTNNGDRQFYYPIILQLMRNQSSHNLYCSKCMSCNMVCFRMTACRIQHPVMMSLTVSVFYIDFSFLKVLCLMNANYCFQIALNIWTSKKISSLRSLSLKRLQVILLPVMQ